MKGRGRLLLVLVVAIALLMALVPAASFADGNKTFVSGLECAYVSVPGQVEYHGYTIHITNQIHQNLFFSDDPDLFPNGTNAAVIDMTVNMLTGKAVVYADAVFQPDGAEDTWVGHGSFLVDTLTGEQLGHGVFHGTGEFGGLTLMVNITTGNPGECPGLPGLMSAGRWSGFIVPAEP